MVLVALLDEYHVICEVVRVHYEPSNLVPFLIHHTSKIYKTVFIVVELDGECLKEKILIWDLAKIAVKLSGAELSL